MLYFYWEKEIKHTATQSKWKLYRVIQLVSIHTDSQHKNISAFFFLNIYLIKAFWLQYWHFGDYYLIGDLPAPKYRNADFLAPNPL